MPVYSLLLDARFMGIKGRPTGSLTHRGATRWGETEIFNLSDPPDVQNDPEDVGNKSEGFVGPNPKGLG